MKAKMAADSFLSFLGLHCCNFLQTLTTTIIAAYSNHFIIGNYNIKQNVFVHVM